MKRRLFNLATAVSLALTIILIVVYLRAFKARDELHTSILRHDCLIATFPHHVNVLLAQHAALRAYPTSITWSLDQYPSRPKYLHPRISNTGLYWVISIPFWLPLLFVSAMPLWRAGRAWTRRRRRDTGLCPTCGYDLRATPGRCPECGAVPAAQLPRD